MSARASWSAFVGLLAAAGLMGCSSSAEVTAPSAPASTETAPATPAAAFSISLPLEPADSANSLGTVSPFGAHFADHGEDGHPGWDLNFRLGGIVRAAADGRVQVVMPIGATNSYTIQVSHSVGGRSYRTDYVGVQNPTPGLTADTPVHAGDPLGQAGTYTQMIGASLLTYAQIHFQLDDFASNAGLTNQNAVCPEGFLSIAARSAFDALWRVAAYSAELLEPFACAPRDIQWPLARTWTRQSGDGPAAIEITRTSPRADFTYRLLDANGTATETGTARAASWVAPATIDLVPVSGSTRYGVYDVLDTTLQLALGAPGASRPSDPASGARYTTAR